jgi:hypothetical protein
MATISQPAEATKSLIQYRTDAGVAIITLMIRPPTPTPTR